jgi:hypothetical protein
MKLIQEFYWFPFGIRQEYIDWCVPASIEAVTKYHQHYSVITQGYLVTEFLYASKGTKEQMGLKSITRLVLEKDKHFSWARKPITYYEASDFHESFKELASFLERSVDKSEPPIISIPSGTNNWHMMTIVGYDETNFQTYDPDPHNIHCYRTRARSEIQNLLRLQKKTNDAATDVLVLSLMTTDQQ